MVQPSGLAIKLDLPKGYVNAVFDNCKKVTSSTASSYVFTLPDGIPAMKCTKCSSDFPNVESNQDDGSFKCYFCRS